MNPSLLRLRWMLLSAQIRRGFRALKTVKGAVMCGVFLLIIGPSLVMGIFAKSRTTFAPDPMIVYAATPLLLLLFCVMALFQPREKQGIPFLPAEVDFLFPAPISRRQLILYKLTDVLIKSLSATTFLTIMSFANLPNPVAVWLGMYFGIVFVTLFGVALPLVAMTVSEFAYSTSRRLGLFLITLLFAAAGLQAVISSFDSGFVQTLKAFRSSYFGMVLLAPFEPFARMASTVSLDMQFLLWTLAAIGVNVVLTWIVVAVDTNFLEASVTASQRLFEKLQRLKRGGLQATGEIKGERTKQLTHFPYWRGAGPILWQQMSSAIRLRSGLKGAAIMVAITLGMLVLIQAKGPGHSAVPGMMGAVVPMIIFTLPSMITYDFRAHIERLDWLKTLPVSDHVMFFGQIVTPIVIASALQWMLLIGIYFLGTLTWDLLLVIAVFIPLANTIMVGMENIFFLLYPTRIATGMDLPATSRNMMSAIFKLFLLSIVIALIAGTGGLSWLLLGKTKGAMIGGCWVGALAASAGIIPVGAVAWRRLDVANDIPT